jgi:hypothetical protein
VQLYAYFEPLDGAGPYLGHSLTGVGDISGDGIDDFVAGAPYTGYIGCGSVSSGIAFMRWFSGIDGSLLRTTLLPRTVWTEAAPCGFQHLAGGEDVNGDGVGDLLAESYGVQCEPGNSGHDNCGWTEVYSGRTGTILWQIRPSSGRGSMLGDLDGDGLSEFGLGLLQDSDLNFWGGRVTVYRGSPGDAERVCQPLANSTGVPAALNLEGPISASENRLWLSVDDAPPGEIGFFFFAPDLVSQPFGDGVLCAGGAPQRVGPMWQVDAAGSVLVELDMTVGAAGSGATAWVAGGVVTLQAWYRDPAGPGGSGFNLTDAFRIVFTE